MVVKNIFLYGEEEGVNYYIYYFKEYILRFFLNVLIFVLKYRQLRRNIVEVYKIIKFVDSVEWICF